MHPTRHNERPRGTMMPGTPTGRSRRGTRRRQSSSSSRIMISPKAIVVAMATAILLLLIQQIQPASCFSSSSVLMRPPPPSSLHRGRRRRRTTTATRTIRRGPADDDDVMAPRPSSPRSSRPLLALSEEEEGEIKALQEKSRLTVLRDRRRTIRGVLKAADGTRNYRLANGHVPPLDPETGEPASKSSDARYALNLTAFVVAAGAVLLRFGGRAALVSALGLDFATENPELRDGLGAVLGYASEIGPGGELALFVLAWTAVKVLCFDAGGVVLALSSGVLFGGVVQGAVASSFAATVGSSVAFALAKMDTPVRKKALEVVEEYPSLRGIEKVVARDGLKAILTLRLAPVLPIPIGMYNYVYGVTNVPYLQFAGGIFLGSMKPYLLDSYLGVFGKQIVDGDASVSGGGMEDALLLIALGASVLIGVFASQLANETWDSINREIEIEKAEKKRAAASAGEGGDDDEDDGAVVREVMGVGLPQWMIGFQLSLSDASGRVNAMIEDEYHAKVWNYTMEEIESPSNDIADPASRPGSPEIAGANTGFDFGASVCEGLVLSPALFGAYLRYADPLYVDEGSSRVVPMEVGATDGGEVVFGRIDETVAPPGVTTTADLEKAVQSVSAGQRKMSHTAAADDLLTVLSALRARLQREMNIL